VSFYWLYDGAAEGGLWRIPTHTQKENSAKKKEKTCTNEKRFSQKEEGDGELLNVAKEESTNKGKEFFSTGK